MKKAFLLFGAGLLLLNAMAQQSPEQFLGYKVGTKFTRHHRVLEYVKSVAASKPDMVKLEKYGETYEGRELMVAIVSAPENMSKLETIREANLKLAGLSKNKNVDDGKTAIVWLSYNVHGNEASSSEAVMLTLYELVQSGNAQTKQWLKNTIVVLDPCINPDGRDRYVNWYNSVAGKNMNVDPQSREHSEPWPGGRSNHYNFDLNRDWAWQTQIETQQRIKLYNQWMPHVHVDFHEQGYNEPYYFAPAAEPFHDVISPWQREFQTMIGRNHAKYFDANGWLYFTRERFDLFYPSYGDTWPTYNGAIGMTYEQGGHSRGGLGVITEDRDTLTLVDRAMHHHTTGLSTIEITASQANKVVAEFKRYFENANDAKGLAYKTYVLTSDNIDKIAVIEKMLKQNGIAYGELSNSSFKGINYTNMKEEAASLKKYHIAVSMLQPRSNLASVMLEPRSNLSDSNTYDITAWGLPYAHGVDAYASKENLAIKAMAANNSNKAIAESSYGYLIEYKSLASAQVLTKLLKKGIKIRMAEKPFTYINKNFAAGTLIVLTKSNPTNLNQIINEATNGTSVDVHAVATGFMDKGADFGSPDVKMILPVRVAMLTGEGASSLGAGEVWHYFEHTLNYPISLLNANDIGRANLKPYDVIIVPDGFYRTLGEKSTADRLKAWVREGGKIIAIENAVNQMATEWGLKMKEDKADDKKDEYSAVKKYGTADRDWLVNATPGAIYKVNLDVTHPLAFGYDSIYYTLKTDANVFEFMKDGWNVGIMKKEAHVAGFVGSKAKPKIKDGMAIGVQEMGRGSVVYFADNPIFRLFWENGKLLIANAVFLVGYPGSSL
jgi:Zinc carboxypeptidase